MNPVSPNELSFLSPFIREINAKLKALSLSDFPKTITFEDLGLEWNAKDREKLLNALCAIYQARGWKVNVTRLGKCFTKGDLYFQLPAPLEL